MSSPTSLEDDGDIKLKTRFQGQVVVLYARPPLILDDFFALLRDACKQHIKQDITVKWIDEDGDPISIDSQMELDEAVRCLNASQEAELNIHVFVGKPELPGLPCQGEDKTVYRRGARRWKKIYLYNGHRFQAKRLNRRIQCFICHDYIWGIGRQGFRCVDCRLCVHKKCHRHVRTHCGQTPQGPNIIPMAPGSGVGSLRGGRLDTSTSTTRSGGIDNGAFHEHEIESPGSANHELNKAANGNGASKWAVSLNDFRLLTVIGRGSYAKVVQAEHIATRQIYAIKIIKKEMFNEDEDIDWVQTEKSVFEAASNYPFLVGLHSCFQTESRLFFVIEFVPGGDLMFHMQQQRKLPEEHARFYSGEIILALHFLHSRGIIYRDLKLDNVLIDAEGHIKLTDYGMCKENINAGDLTSTFCGTPNYIAPEILRGDEYGFSVDWWALGVLMFEMMAGRSPFDIVGMQNAEENTEDYLFQIILERQIRIPRSLSVRASTILKGFLNKDPTERLGCKLDINEGLRDMKEHQFFRGFIDWDALEQKAVAPPYHPAVESDRDLTHFDHQFTDEPPQLSPDNSAVIARIDQSEFDGFEYVNPLQMSREDSV
ncbi:hypothetical protein CAEBREN_11897 [Caenorhabditis brenneri]|uniref:Protein kinase C n=1 Tax=Caenorhabditis brenneri TaxID=135651 RepID=G0PDG0_CAEBE|nr:hypothetical protein CAEBREN_16602 [Caenorhabditis brenneri]EGT56371.1 hypothetical protein CAEBREN_11897 [Caenorhabditis brenneri]